MDTRNSKFRQGFALEVWEVESFGFGKCSQNFLRSLPTLQEVGKHPTWVYFSSKGRIWPWLSPKGCLVGFSNVKMPFSGFLDFWDESVDQLVDRKVI